MTWPVAYVHMNATENLKKDKCNSAGLIYDRLHKKVSESKL